MPTTVTSLVIIVLFVLPGFVFDWTLERLVPQRAKGDLVRILSALFFSGLLWLIPGMPIYRYWLRTQNISGTAWRSAIFIVAIPLVLGAAVAVLGPPLREFLSKTLRIRVQDPHPTAWDWAMSRRAGDWIIVQTTDGGLYGGIYGADSQAGVSTTSPDLYLEQSWKIDAKTKRFLNMNANSGGLYFPASSIHHIEFRKPPSKGAVMSDDDDASGTGQGNEPTPSGPEPTPSAPDPAPPAPEPTPPAPELPPTAPKQAPPPGDIDLGETRLRPLETPDVTNPPQGDEE